MDFFSILRNILTKPGKLDFDNPDVSKNFSVYMLIRYLSMRDSLLPYALIIQQMAKSASLSDRAIYEFAYNHVPVSNPFIKYIKKKKD